MKIKQSIERSLKQFPFAYNILRKIYRTLTLAPPAATDKIEEILKKKPSVFFVQVGSNDGVQGDPIHNLISRNKMWAGIFIEPVGYIFQRLMKNYHNDKRFIFENVAIGAKKGRVKFYYVSEDAKAELGDDLPFWYDQLGSFNKDYILNHLHGKVEPYLVEEEVECVTLQEIFERNNVKKIDLLHIDTEGFDYKVLSQVNFERYKPMVVLYEHRHLSVDEKEKAKLLFKRSGYNHFEYGGDTLAIFKG